jgi:hypothetical protein
MSSILKVDEIQDTSGNNIINESSDTITIGASGDTVNVVGTLQNNGSALASGITMADQWRLTANATAPSGDITTNLERIDTSGQGTLGTGMTESSGIFSFPSTGIYEIYYTYHFTNISAGDQDRCQIVLNLTTDNSSFAQICTPDSAVDGTANGGADIAFACTLVDVTDISNVKVKFTANSFKAGTTLSGNTDQNRTVFTFIRLGDT